MQTRSNGPVDVPEPGPRGPRGRAGLVRRDGILERLRALPGSTSLVLLTAPAGYGKTTVLDQWAAEGPGSFVRVTLEDADDDPARLLQRLVDALHRLEPVDDLLLASVATRDSPRGVVVPRLLAWLAGHAGGRVLVLDDLHRLRSAGSLDVVRALARRLPPGWRLAVASRCAPVPALAPLRGPHRSLELGAEDLVLSTAEARRLLAGTGTDLPEKEVRRLVERTEGWPAGIYLAALSLREGAGAGGPSTAWPADGDVLVGDWFRTEVLTRQPPDVWRFLLRTSMLERMSGPLCDAVLAEPGSAVRLEEFTRSNLFVVPQDRDGEWYRYHRLFAGMLLAELRLREPGEERVLHARAARWFADHALPEEAIRHAVAAGDLATAARLTTQYATPFSVTGRIATVRGWLETLGDAGVEAYPPLAVMATWVSALEGEPEKARHYLALAENASFNGATSDGSSSLEAGIAVIRAAMAPHGVGRMLTDARRAVELEPPGSRWHPFASWVLGSAELLHGEPGRAAKAFERAAFLGREDQKPAASLALAQLALLAAAEDDREAAAAHAAEAQALVVTGHLQDYPSSMASYAACAVLAARAGDRASAVRNIGHAMRLTGAPRPAAFPWLVAQVSIVLGELLLELDDVPAARLKAAEAQAHLARLPDQGALRGQLERLLERLARHPDPGGQGSVLTLTRAELRVLALLPTHLTLGEISLELGVTRNTVKSHVSALRRKLGVTTRADTVRQARQLGLLRG